MTGQSGKRSAGQDRRTAILDAAAQVFFEQGYAATSIDAIIARSGGSKRNIYSAFGNKAGLFTALVSEAADEALEALTVDDLEAGSLPDTLHRFANRLLTAYMSPKLVGLMRVVMAEAYRFPELAQGFYEKGPGRATLRLADVLEAATRRGEIDAVDHEAAASLFVGMLRDNVHLQVILGLRPPLDASQIDTRSALTVRLFLDGLRPRA